MSVTSVLLILCAGPSGSVPSLPTDYWVAQDQARKQNKPLAVLVGTGASGYQKLTHQGSLPSNVQKMLADHFVAVYVDASANDGKRLADQLEIKTVGLVISDRSGNYQTFRREGSMSEAELLQTLERLGTTQTRTSFYQPSPISTQTYAAPAGRMMRGC